MFQFIDSQVYYLFYSNRSDFFNNFFIAITSFGAPLIALVITVLVSFLLIKKGSSKYAYFLLSNIVVGQIITYFVKNITNTPRPSLLNALVYESNSSFPSGHTMIAITLFFSLLIILNRDVFKISIIWKSILRIFIGFLIVMIPISRLYLGIHWMSDVVGALFIGLFIVMINAYIFKIHLPKNDKMRKLLKKYFK